MNEDVARLQRPLIQLAKLAGIGTSYVGQGNDYHEIDDDVLVSILAALGIDAKDDAAIAQAQERIAAERASQLVEPTVLHTVGEDDTVLLHAGILAIPTVSITLEDGTPFASPLRVTSDGDAAQLDANGNFVATVAVHLPADLPLGYHTLHVQVGERSQDAVLISAPREIKPVAAMQRKQLWGWMAQLYSVRSSRSWGVGDFADLSELLTEAKRKTNADFVLVNPLHASEPVTPLTPSPYLPISRRFVNFTYIHPEAIAEYARLDAQAAQEVASLHDRVEPLNADAQLIDRDEMWRAKMRALWLIFKVERSAERQREFESFKRQAGESLTAYATWCLCYDKLGAPSADPENWIRRYTKESSAVHALREQFPDTFDFYCWLEWIAMRQLRQAQEDAKSAGMALGVIADMAVGVHPCGSEVWWNPENFAQGATVGAPPDYFNQQGQDWSQPPLNPLALHRTGYQAYRQMVHDIFSAAGAVRIDHILGLFRLWWIPQGKSPKQGAYVYYHSEIMLGILAIEAARADGVVIGEDLGVVPQYVRESLAHHGVLGCAVEWFEQRDGAFLPPQTWREGALASVNTHDLPPAAGYLEYEQVKIRERLHLLDTSSQEFMYSAVREHQAMLAMLVQQGFLDEELLRDEQAHQQQIVEALYRAIKASPSRLLGVSLVDAVGERRAQNQPGTNNEYPNWRIPLADAHGNAVLLDTLFDNERVQSLARIMNE